MPVKYKIKTPVIKSTGGKFKPIKFLQSIKSVKFSKKTVLRIILGLVLIFIIFRIIIGFTSKRFKSQDMESVIPVEVTKARFDVIRDILYLTERLQAESEVQVFSPVSGWLDKLYVDIGSKVSKRSAVALIDRNIIGSEYTKAVVQAPISGEVSRIFLDVGATVAPNTPIMTIQNYDTIKIDLNIPEKYISRIKINDPVLINVEWTDEEFIGKIEKKSETIDPLTGTFKAKVVIPNKLHKLKPGSFAKVKIVMDYKKAIIISKDALVEYEEQNPFVYKITNNIVRKVYVKPGITEETNVEILEGLSEGDILVTMGKEIVHDGAKVKITGGEK